MTFALIDGGPDGGDTATLIENPTRIITAHNAAEIAGAVQALETALAEGMTAIGFFSYELGYLMDAHTAALLPATRDLPLLWFALSKTPQHVPATAWLDAKGGTHTITPPTPAWPRDTYVKKCTSVLDNITAGEVYQINLTFKSHFQLSGDPVSLYRTMHKRQSCAYGACISAPDFSILSASPELFFEKHGRAVTVKPMKGTAPRGIHATDDNAQKTALAADPKQRAENVMIVDLMRNDLGRVAETGSVKVDRLFDIETYPSLHQMTSQVSANLKPDTNLTALLHALFPAGSITGAPKIRAMEIIRGLEDAPRGVYCGAIGILHPNGDARFNVAIRTVHCRPDGACDIGIGSGVVADSAPTDEYDECLLKMRFLAPPVQSFSLIETMQWHRPEGLVLWAEHAARLDASARHYGFACDMDAIIKALAAHTHTLTDDTRMVRLVLQQDGTFNITSSALTLSDAPMRYKMATQRMDSHDHRLFHKTTDRAFYDDAHKAATADNSCDEILFLNERDELTEGSRTTLFIEKDGVLLTPPVSSGLLAGTLRARLLAEGRAREAVLKMPDLEAADKVFLGNSVRGLRVATRVL